MSEYELIPDSVVESIERTRKETKSPVERFYEKKAKELGRRPTPSECQKDYRFAQAQAAEKLFNVKAAKNKRDWRIYQLENLGEWVLRHVGTWRDRYNQEASFRDLSQMFPTRVNREEVRATVEHLVHLGLIEKFKWKGSRGPSTVRYCLTSDGATLMADHLEEPTYGTVETEPDGATGSGVDAGPTEPEGTAGATERRVGADGAPEEGREGGLAGEAEPGTVARRGAGADARGEDSGEARPHGDAAGVE